MLCVMACTVAGDVLHRAKRQAVPTGIGSRLVPPGHAAVGQGQLTEQSARPQPRKLHEIDNGLRVSAPLQHATGPGPQGEDVSWTAQVGGAGLRMDGRLYGTQPVGGGHAGGHAFGGLDADG